MNKDTVEIIGSWEDVSRDNCLLLTIQIKLNGGVVEWNDIDIYSLALYWMNHEPGQFPEFIRSAFQPFSCSCGIAGCAGIYDGIYIKERKYSVEWRAKKEDGYEFLPKTFFSFEKHHYASAFNKFFFWLMTQEDVDKKLCVDLGYYSGDETTVEDFFNWLEKCK